jgi:hypothetical protein
VKPPDVTAQRVFVPKINSLFSNTWNKMQKKYNRQIYRKVLRQY